MEIGKPVKVIICEPLELPEPLRQPSEQPAEKPMEWPNTIEEPVEV